MWVKMHLMCRGFLIMHRISFADKIKAQQWIQRVASCASPRSVLSQLFFLYGETVPLHYNTALISSSIRESRPALYLLTHSSYTNLSFEQWWARVEPIWAVELHHVQNETVIYSSYSWAPIKLTFGSLSHIILQPILDRVMVTWRFLFCTNCIL